MASVTTDRRRGINATAAIKVPCVCATTANITLSGEQTIDGVTTSETRVFVKNQTDATENGIYLTATGGWSREPDFDGSFDVSEGTVIPVSRGTANADTYWRITNTGTIEIGTTELTFAATTVLSSAILNDGSVKMIANFEPNVDATYSLGVSTGQWTSIFLSSAVNANSAALSSNLSVGGTFQSSGTATLSSNATVGGTLQVTGATSLSSDATVAGTLQVTGESSIGGNATVSGNAVVSGTLSAGDTVTMSSNATISGALQSSGTVTGSSRVLLTGLPTTDPGVLGELWENSGNLQISTG